MPSRSLRLPVAAAVLLAAASPGRHPAQQAGERCYELRIVPVEASVAPMARAAEILAGPVILTREPAGRPSAPDAHPFYRVERPSPRTPWSSRGFRVWTEVSDDTIWLGGAAVPAPGGERAASARLFEHEGGHLRGRLEVDLEIPSGDGHVGEATTIGTVTARPVPCDPPEVVMRGRRSPEASASGRAQ